MRIVWLWLCLLTSVMAADGFVRRSGAGFTLDGNSFHPAGTNCYYLTYKPQAMVDAALADAKAMGLQVVRVWGFLDCGEGDPGATTPVLPSGHKDGVYFQYWDTATDSLTINDGPDGLRRLDYVVYKAGQLGLKVTITLVNNWDDFGGMDQYVDWFGGTYHDQFYSDTAIRAAYGAYATHLVGRTNFYTGRQYRDEPAIFAWELANEPRCRNGSGSDRASGAGSWSNSTITTWAAEMADVLQTLDPNHLVAVGDEGFYERSGGGHWAYTRADGVDHEALIALADIDFATFHLYPDHWGTDVAWGTTWIERHCALAATAGKPTVLEEYGYQRPEHTEAERMSAYAAWNDALRLNGGDGAWFWMIASYDPTGPGSVYPDYDHFTVYLDGVPWRPGDARVDDDDVLASRAWSLRGLDNRAPTATASVAISGGGIACDGRASSDPDGHGLSYRWNFGDGASIGGVAAPRHAYAVAGTYTVTLTVQDPYGASDTDTVSMTVAIGSGAGGAGGPEGEDTGSGCGLGGAVALLMALAGLTRPFRRRPGA